MAGRPRAVTGAIAWVALAACGLLTADFALPCMSTPASAAIRHHHWQGDGPGLTDPDKDAALIVDGITGRTLYARNADVQRHPASLTKMMTLYLLFEQLKSGQMTLATPISISEHAASQHPTKLHLRPGSTIPVDIAIKAIVVRSANDVAVAIAEAIGMTESHFAELMTAKARALGMSHTFYANASGLPDNAQITTAADLSILARHLAYDFPQYFPYFATPAFSYRGETYVTHDNLIGNYDGADGIKTGYTEASGFNLVSSVVRNGAHVIGVVMGGRSARKRDREMVALLDSTFMQINQNPRMVARANVPWQAIAENTRPAPIIAGFQLGLEGGPAVPAAAPQRANGSTDGEDEDAAESRRDPDDEQPALAQNPAIAAAPQTGTPASANVLTAMMQAPAPSVGAPRTARFVPPAPRPAPVMQVAYHPQSRPLVVPKARAAALGEGDIGDAVEGVTHTPALRGPMQAAASALSLRDWTIQIGAYADMTSARAQLASYAERSMDVLGQAERIVVPFQSEEGQTLYRARFGPFVEKEAREVCQRLTERGQTCFAAVAQR